MRHFRTGRRVAVPLAVALLAAGTLAVVRPALATGLPGDDIAFSSAVLRSTHNSFSGHINGDRGSLAYQLEHGIRSIELDINDGDYQTVRDFTVGHGSAGAEVDPADNPTSNRLADWLAVVSDWSWAHPNHVPLVITLDLKGDLTDNSGFAAGNLTALNDELVRIFGSRLVAPDEVPGVHGTVGSLRGRIIPILSGDVPSRTEYVRDVGFNPSVALNRSGQVVEVHDSGGSSPTLWYWTGVYGPNGRVTWLRHGRYDTGKDPAVALNDDGWLVEVHKSENADTLWYRVGRLDSAGEITWSSSRQFDTGVMPTIRFADGSSTVVREIHRSQSSSQNWDWRAALNTTTWTVAWSSGTHGKTSDPRFDSGIAESDGRLVQVWTGTDGPAPQETLKYGTDRNDGGRIRYQQRMFGECQPGDAAVICEPAMFYAGPALDTAFLSNARVTGHIVRAWDYDGPVVFPTPNYPATNFPWSTEYLRLPAIS